MSDFNWGILGPGGIARAFAADLQQLAGHRVGAVGSRTLSNAQKFAITFGESSYGSYEELISDPAIDAIYVATPHPAHKDNVIAALNAGKPVLATSRDLNTDLDMELKSFKSNTGINLFFNTKI